MESIRKIICVDGLRSHRCGLAPYICFNQGSSAVTYVNSATTNGNYGQYVCDFLMETPDGDSRLRYLDILKWFHFTDEAIRNGMLVRKITTEQERLDLANCEEGYIYSRQSGYTVTTMVSGSPIPYMCEPLNIAHFAKRTDILYDYIPENDADGDTAEALEKNCECYLLINDYDAVKSIEQQWDEWWSNGGYDEWETTYLSEEYENNAGFKFYYDVLRYLFGDELEDGANASPDAVEWILEEKGNLHYVSPRIDMDLCIEASTAGEFGYVPYEYSLSGDTVVSAVKDYVPEENSSLKPSFITLEAPFKVESRLDELISENASSIMGGYGIWEDFENGGQMFRCVYEQEQGNAEKVVKTEDGYWNCYAVDSEEAKTYRLPVRGVATATTYESIPLLSCIPFIVGSAATYGMTKYFLARHDNDENRPVSLPFQVDTPIDDGFGGYNSVISIMASGNEITFIYAMGMSADENGEIIEDSGVWYKETLPYKGVQSASTVIEGTYESVIYYTSVDFSKNDTVYSEEYKMYRKARLSEVIKMEVGSVWTSDGAVSAMLITKDGWDLLQDNPMYSVDIAIDRGSAAAWEKHFKLSECNTMDDLKKYGNNFFNL